jgi:hypothetical protein
MRKKQFDEYFTSPLLDKPPTGPTLPDGDKDSAYPEDEMAARLKAADIALQLGVGTSGGTEIAAHLIRTHLEENPNDAAFKNDFKNAFNAMSRRQLVKLLLLSPFADLEPSVRFFYEHAGLIYFDGERLGADSCEGCQQGDPLGPFLFA